MCRAQPPLTPPSLRELACTCDTSDVGLFCLPTHTALKGATAEAPGDGTLKLARSLSKAAASRERAERNHSEEEDVTPRCHTSVGQEMFPFTRWARLPLRSAACLFTSGRQRCDFWPGCWGERLCSDGRPQALPLSLLLLGVALRSPQLADRSGASFLPGLPHTFLLPSVV